MDAVRYGEFGLGRGFGVFGEDVRPPFREELRGGMAGVFVCARRVSVSGWFGEGGKKRMTSSEETNSCARDLQGRRYKDRGQGGGRG